MKLAQRNPFLRAPEGEFPSNGGGNFQTSTAQSGGMTVFDDAPDDDDPEPQFPSGESTPAGNGQQAPASGQPDLATAVAEGLARFNASRPQQQAPQPAQRQMTQDEIESALKVFKVTPALAKEFRDALAQDHGAGALSNVLGKIFSGLMTQAATYSDVSAQFHRGEIEAKFQPVADYAISERQRRNRAAFFKEYPELKNFEKVIPSIAQTIDPTGKTQEAIRKEIATGVEAFVKSIDPNFTLSKPQAQPQGGRTPAQTSGGGMGGGTRSTASRPVSTSIWD